MTTALLIIDVQHALCHGVYAGADADHVIARINLVSGRVRQSGGLVVVIQHASPAGALVHGSRGWAIADGLVTHPGDVLLGKTAADAFHHTPLDTLLRARGVTQLVICGLQTEFCVDTTTRRALALGYPVTLVADGHTTTDNTTLSAAQIRAHHNETLAQISSFGPRAVALPAAEVLGTA